MFPYLFQHLISVHLSSWCYNDNRLTARPNVSRHQGFLIFFSEFNCECFPAIVAGGCPFLLLKSSFSPFPPFSLHFNSSHLAMLLKTIIVLFNISLFPFLFLFLFLFLLSATAVTIAPEQLPAVAFLLHLEHNYTELYGSTSVLQPVGLLQWLQNIEVRS